MCPLTPLAIALLLSASPGDLRTALGATADRVLPREGDGAAIVSLADGELLLAHHPKVLAADWPSGSLAKLVTATAVAAEPELANHRSTCRGSLRTQTGTVRCWEPRGHGPLDLPTALAVSCNLHFRELGSRVAPEGWLAAARALGLGRETAAPIAGQEAGVLPRPGPGTDWAEVGSGEGLWTRITPLQAVQLASRIATGREVLLPSRPDGAWLERAAPLPAEAVELLREGMRRSVERGTSSHAGLGPLDVAGKTGTARWLHGYRTHAWFIGWLPRERPTHAIAVFVEEGRGGEAAAEAARLLLSTLVGRPPPPEAGEGVVRVRLLEKRQPHAFTVSGTEPAGALCDGRALPAGPFAVTAHADRLEIGGASATTCIRLELKGPRLSLELLDGPPRDRQRRYAGTLRLVAKGEVIGVVGDLPREAYVAGVVASESITRLPAALEAQAIVSRTYAASQRRRHPDADLCDLTHCQVFAGLGDAATTAAAEATAGRVLTQRGRPVAAYFHSTCGGRTRSNAALGESGEALLPGVVDASEDGRPWCRGSPHFRWTRRWGGAALRTLLELPGVPLEAQVLERDAAGSVERLSLLGRPLEFEQLQQRIGRNWGWNELPSASFDLRPDGDAIRLDGRGLGHGVGLCQEGAAAMAKSGRSASQILRHYFPTATLETPRAP